MNSEKLQDTKINTQKSVAFLYTNNGKSEREIKKPIYPCIKKNNIPRNKTKWSKYLYLKNFKLMKVTEDDTNSWENIPCS